MTSAESIVTVLVAILGSGGLWTTLQQFKDRNTRKQEQRAAAARESAEQERASVTKAQMLAEAQALAQKTALDSAHTAYESVRDQCDACQLRLTRAEQRIVEHEQSERRNEIRIYDLEQRERKHLAVMRKTVRAIDSSDPTTVTDAVAAMRDLI